MADQANSNDMFYVNGINGTSGNYALEPLTQAQLANVIRDEGEPENLAELKKRNEKSQLMAEILKERLATLEGEQSRLSGTQDAAKLAALEKEIRKIRDALDERKVLGTIEGVDQNDLAQAGWGIIFPEKADPAIKEALSELLKLRQNQAGAYFRVFEGDDGYRSGDTYLQFLARHGAGPGPVDPEKGVPYYLLIVGGPEAIPYNFQYQLDVQFGVGRIDFGPNLDDYALYARSVVAAETGEVKLARRATFFGVSNPDDRATEMSTKHLVTPLYNKLTTKKDDWEFDLFVEAEAAKAQLADILKGEHVPSLLFTASHGMEFAMQDPRHLLHQGALLCQDWDGPIDHAGPISQDLYFAGDDLESQTNLLGLITFHFACYSAGTPRYDEFSRLRSQRKRIAENPFLAHLPRQLLSHGALAAVGHVERAWGYSFFWPDSGEQLAVFESTLERLLNGHPIGSAIEYFNERYAEIATILNEELDQVDAGRSPANLPGLWTANHDARNYIVVGDPAARLPVVREGETTTARPLIEVAGIAATAPKRPGKPASAKPFDTISDEDWQNTPPAVQELLWKLKKK